MLDKNRAVVSGEYVVELSDGGVYTHRSRTRRNDDAKRDIVDGT